MKRTWKPRVAGILAIIVGAVPVTVSIVLVALGGVTDSIPVTVFLLAVCAPAVVLGIIAIVGGRDALRRRNWGLALAGSICTLILGILMVLAAFAWFNAVAEGFENLSIVWLVIASVLFGIPGILATIFVVMAKPEFRGSAEPLH